MFDIGDKVPAGLKGQEVWGERTPALCGKLSNHPCKRVRNAVAMAGKGAVCPKKHHCMNMFLHACEYERLIGHNGRDGEPTEFNGGVEVHADPRKAAIKRIQRDIQENGTGGRQVDVAFGAWTGFHVLQPPEFRLAWAMLHQETVKQRCEVCPTERCQVCFKHQHGYSNAFYKLTRDNFGVQGDGDMQARFGFSPLNGRKKGGAGTSHSLYKVLDGRDRYVVEPFIVS
uniref:Uncharacterized protein n=1 Tax=Hemiselmis andersenii TaxID=464988 RepID=A0A7S0TXK8_HEMAN